MTLFMRSVKIFIFLFMTSVAASFAQTVEGDWYGELDMKAIKLRIAFHITSTNGALSCTMDVPDQNATALPLSSVRLEGNALFLEHEQLKMKYNGTLSGDSLIGEFEQMGQKFPLKLSRKSTALLKRHRPQTPISPFPYEIEEVRFKQRIEGFYLAGTLTIPHNKKDYPLVVMATGSGQQDRDETLFDHKPFWVIADYFARQGIATLRIDDRGVGQSQGDARQATTFDFAEDIQSAIDYLASRKDICTKRIGIVGHSEGALIGSVLAAKAKSEKHPTRFVVMMAGSGVPGDQIVVSQAKAINQKLDPSFDFSSYEELYKRIFNVIKDMRLSYEQVAMKGKLTVDSLSITDQQKQAIYPMFMPWYVEFIRLNPAYYLMNATCPIFALIGSNDLQVFPDLNFEAIKKATKSNKSQVKLQQYPGLNHLFQHAPTGLPTEYADIEETIAPEVLEDMAEWILNIK